MIPVIYTASIVIRFNFDVLYFKVICAYFLVRKRTGYQVANNPIMRTVINTYTKSLSNILTGQEFMIKSPSPLPKESKPNCCCKVSIIKPKNKPIKLPARLISIPSTVNIFLIRFLSAPILFSIAISFSFSTIKMEREPIILKDARIRMNSRIRKMISFSDFNILYKASFC